MTNLSDIAMDTDTPVRGEGSERSNSTEPTTETQQPTTMPNGKPVIIGLYGVPGCGKTYLLKKLKEILDEGKVGFFEGSAIIDHLVTGGLDKFRTLNDEEKICGASSLLNGFETKPSKAGNRQSSPGISCFGQKAGNSSQCTPRLTGDLHSHPIYGC